MFGQSVKNSVGLVLAVTPIRRHSESSSRRYDEEELENVMREIHDSFPPEPSKSTNSFDELSALKSLRHTGDLSNRMR